MPIGGRSSPASRPDTTSLSIDRIRLAAGLAGAGVAKIEPLLSDGSHLVAVLTDDHGCFQQRVRTALVPPNPPGGARPAYDASGRVLAARPGDSIGNR